jgi:hypothetical protein
MASFIFIAAAQNVWADTVTVTPSLKNPTLHRVLAEPTKFKGRDAVQITEDPKLKSAKADRLAIVPGAEIDDGVIEISLAGEPAKGAATGARGFVGIAFRVANDQSEFELVYFRPTNGRADDQLRRNHTVQYDAFPDYPWHKLRRESPGKYESYVDTVPGEWTDVKIEVKGTTAKVYAHGAKQPCLVVNDLKLGESKGAVALWIGPGTVAHFSDLRISDGF